MGSGFSVLGFGVCLKRNGSRAFFYRTFSPQPEGPRRRFSARCKGKPAPSPVARTTKQGRALHPKSALPPEASTTRVRKFSNTRPKHHSSRHEHSAAFTATLTQLLQPGLKISLPQLMVLPLRRSPHPFLPLECQPHSSPRCSCPPAALPKVEQPQRCLGQSGLLSSHR